MAFGIFDNKVRFRSIQKILGKLEISIMVVWRNREKVNAADPISIKIGGSGDSNARKERPKCQFAECQLKEAQDIGEEHEENPMSIIGKWYQWGTRTPTHCAATSGQRESARAELMTLTPSISYTYGNESQ